jgi:hypothetical protein
MLKAWAEHDADTFRGFTETARANGVDPFRSRVLDVGCGSNAPMSLLLHSAGATVTGIDAYIGHRWGLGIKPSRYVAYAQEAGALKAIRKLVGEIVYDRHYYATLARKAGLKLTSGTSTSAKVMCTRSPFQTAASISFIPTPRGSIS